MTKLRQSTVDAACVAARLRYSRMEEREATLSFAYELQGYFADSIDRGASFEGLQGSIIELMDLFKKAQLQ